MGRLAITGVFDTVMKIAKTKGQGSQDIKRGLVERMLREGKGEEVRYLTRTLVQHVCFPIGLSVAEANKVVASNRRCQDYDADSSCSCLFLDKADWSDMEDSFSGWG